MTPICSSTFGFCPNPSLRSPTNFAPSPDAIPRSQNTSGHSLRPRNSSSGSLSCSIPDPLPHYVQEGKSYLTIAFGCTGGQHRSVMIAEEVGKRLRKAKYRLKIEHRDSPK